MTDIHITKEALAVRLLLNLDNQITSAGQDIKRIRQQLHMVEEEVETYLQKLAIIQQGIQAALEDLRYKGGMTYDLDTRTGRDCKNSG